MRSPLPILIILLFSVSLCASSQESRLLRQPTISSTSIAFVYANDIWTVERGGGMARRLTTSEGAETDPRFSPDGAWIAFTGQYDGNTDVYIVPSSGGEPKRLTFHPGGDFVRGWTPDGRNVVFSSGRTSAPVGFPRLWTISVEGGLPQPLPMQMAHKAAYSPDGGSLAFVPFTEAFQVWRHYRGGRTARVWILNSKTLDLEKIPRDNSNDTDPMWIGSGVYFLSDRNGTVNLFSYDTKSKQVSQLTRHADFDVKSATTGDGVIVYEQAGWIHLYDPKTTSSKRISITVNGDLPWARPHFVKVGTMTRNFEVSPTGTRAVFEARGDIFTVPAEKGDVRNLTNSTGVHDRDPAWSPDGKRIAWFSDKGGEYRLVIGEQTGLEPPKVIPLENPSFYYAPTWSPDSKKLAFTDNHLTLWSLDLDGGKPVKVDTDTYDHPQRTLFPSWSPDSKWITYSKRLENHMHAVFIYSLTGGKAHQVTDGLSDAISPSFDQSGKHLFFLASTNFGLNTGWLDMTSYDRPVTRSVYLAVLAKDAPSPLAPESDEEKGESKDTTAASSKSSNEKEKKEKKDTSSSKIVKIDLEGLDQRVIAVDKISPRDYRSLTAGDGAVFYLESVPNQTGATLHSFDMKKRESTALLIGINNYVLSANGKKILYAAPNSVFGIVDAAKAGKVGDGKLKTDVMEVKIDPRAEWAQMYDEAWRINRDYFYDPTMHGADWKAIKEKYRPWVQHVGHRSDLSYVLAHMLGELVVGHSYISGGDAPTPPQVRVGLLGADYTIESGYYRISRILTGENWNPELRAPLTEPGSNVAAGEYILAVNGRPLRAPENIYGLFEGTAGKQTVLLVNGRPTEQGARKATVIPVESESALRQRAWIENNRRRVDELSNGKLAYVYLPNTSGAGYTNFNRYYYMQMHREGAVIDERFNGGGSAADYMVDMMNRPLLNYWATRDGKDFQTPTAVINGPKVMIINEHAGSGGDALPYYFRDRKIGPLVGTRTWGGLVGIYDYPVLIDGGSVTAPRVAFYNKNGKWEVENEGVPPDIEVEQLPKEMKDGRDPQLERAVNEAMRLLEKNPPAKTKRAPYPRRVK
ncbi:MAG TPA: protease [Bacteroidetes bacterium]|nr:protease [Bacteroidota bacterium]